MNHRAPLMPLGPAWQDFDDRTVVSVGEFLQSCTIPLLFEDSSTSFIHGTGCLFKGVEHLYLITAKHVVTSRDFDRVAVPINPSYGHYWSLGRYTVSFPSDDNLDVAVVRLEDPGFPTRIGVNWRCLGPENLISDASSVDRFIIAGYPTTTATKEGNELLPKPFQLYTRRYTGAANDGQGSFDIMLSYAREGRDAAGRDIPTPPVEGVSGAAVWAVIDTPVGGMWTPERQLKLAGVQVSYVHSKYIRAKSWGVLREVFRQIDPDTYRAMRDDP